MLFKFILTIKPLNLIKCYVKIEKCVKIEKSGRGRPGRGVVLEIRTTHPDKGRGVV